jgi:hypothetical protein
MIELLIWLGSVAVFLAAGVAAGWHLGRAREMKRVSQRVSIVLGQVERRHKKELGRFQAGFAKQARELKEARAKQRLREAADNLAQAQAQQAHAQGRPAAPKQKPSEHGFAPTQPMQHVNH